MNLSPERQAEYDAMGLPWTTFVNLELLLPKDKLMVINTINMYHTDQQTIEVLTTKVEQLKGLLYYASQWIDYEDPVDRVCFEALDSQIKAALNPKEKI